MDKWERGEWPIVLVLWWMRNKPSSNNLLGVGINRGLKHVTTVNGTAAAGLKDINSNTVVGIALGWFTKAVKGSASSIFTFW